MKKSYLGLSLLLVSLLLAGCGGDGGSTAAPTSSAEAETPSYKIKNAKISVASDWTYDISFSTDSEVKEAVKFYVSSNSKYNASDAEVEVTRSGTSFSFDYTEYLNDFYLLMVGGTGNDVYAKINFVIPTFKANVVSGTGNNAGLDVITFDYLDNGYGSEMFIDDGSLTIYRQGSAVLDKSAATKVKEGVSIAAEFDVATSSDAYYFFDFTSNGGSAAYTSQAFEKDVVWGSDLVGVASASISAADGIKLHVAGSVLDSGAKEMALGLISSADTTLAPVAVTKSGDAFAADYDLSLISSALTDYKAYILFGAGLYEAISSSAAGEALEGKTLSGTKIYGFDSSSEQLAILYQDKGAINVFGAKLILDGGKPYFSAKGMYDETQFSADAGGTSNPVLLINNDQNGEIDAREYALTLDAAADTFEVKADLSPLTKLGAWYNVKLYFNSDKTTDDSGNVAYAHSATYEFLKTDCTDFGAKVTDVGTSYQYGYQEYSGFLKIAFTDVSAQVASWAYVNKNGDCFLRLSGTYAKGAGTHIEVTDKASFTLTGAIVPAADYSFVCDIDVTTIEAKKNYSVYWVYGTGNYTTKSDEITNKYFAKPTAVASDGHGYVYCVKQESWEANRYYKVYKDQDAAKANAVAFKAQNGKNVFELSGAINSTVAAEDLYLQYAPLDDNNEVTGGFYTPVTVGGDLMFTSSFDLANIAAKGIQYECRLVAKAADGSYAPIASGDNAYCGFYNEYLPNDFASNKLVADGGTYRVATHAGENSLWTLYLYLE